MTSFGRRIAFYEHPNLTDRRFLFSLIIQIPIFIGQLWLNRSISAQSFLPEFTLTSLYGLPVIYSAFNLGLYSTFIISGVGVVLVQVDIIRNIRFGYSVGIWADYIQIVIVVITGCIVAHFVEIYKSARDQSEQAAERHRVSEARYRSLFNGTSTPIAVTDLFGNLSEVNPAFMARFEGLGQDGSKTQLTDIVSWPKLFESFIEGENNSISHDETREITKPPSFSIEQAMETTYSDPFNYSFSFNNHVYRVEISRLSESIDNTPLLQIIFHDVSEEEHQRMMSDQFTIYIMQGQEEERKRIAQELHDDPLQKMVQLYRLIENVKRDLNSKDSSNSLNEAKTLTQDVAQSLRNISSGLRPQAIADLGLSAGIESLISHILPGCQVDIGIQVDGDEVPLDENVELALYRICQEALNNALAHSRCTEVRVLLAYRLDHVNLSISDNGIGLSETNGTSDGRVHLGMIGMKERARSIGADLSIGPGIETGTTITVTYRLQMDGSQH